MIKLTFDFPPVAQARPRATRFGKGIRLYDPKQVHIYKAQLAQSAQFMYHDGPLAGPNHRAPRYFLPTKEGLMALGVGDWITTGVDGEHWAIADDIFRRTYEEIDGND